MEEPRPIRVLRVIARLNVGGPSLHVAYLTDELDRRGYETTLVAGTVGPGEGSMEYVVRERGIEPRRLSFLQRDLSPFHDAISIWQLRKLIRRTRPDILHTHTAKAGAVGRIAALVSGSARPRAVVHTFHGHVLRGYFSPQVTWIFSRIERWLARRTDRLVAVSTQVRDDLVKLGIGTAETIDVVRLGLDLDARTHAEPGARARERESLGIGDGVFLVGWLGRMTEVKRVDVLVEAFARLRRDVDAELALVGDGPLRPELEAQAARLGVADQVHFLGYRDAVGPLYQAFDALALTSVNEGTPVTLIEGLAAGRPAVATDVGGVADVVEDGLSGFLVPAGDSAAVAEGLGRLAHDPDLRARMGEHGRSSAQERFSVPQLVDNVDALYLQLLGLRPSTEEAEAGAVPVHERGTRIYPVKRRLRVILLSQYYPPEIGATQSRMQSFAELLSEHGHKVTVIAELPNHPHGVIPQEYRGMLYDDDTSDGYRVLRVWVKASPEKTQRTRMTFYLSYMTLATVLAPLAGRADVVVATSPPLFTGAAGLAIARMNRAPLVLDVRDLWPAAAVSLKQIDVGPSLRLAEGLERLLYREAAAVTAVTRPFCEYIDARKPAGTPTVLLPNGTLELFFNGQDGSPKSVLGAPEDSFLVTFAGTHGIAQALPSVLDAAARVGDGIHFALIGDGPTKAALLAQAAENGLSNVYFHPQVPIEEMPPLLRASDALLVPLAAHPTFESFVPSKMIDFMAVGRPVILSARGESQRLLETAGAGVAVAPEDPAALADAVMRLARDSSHVGRMVERGQAFARTRTRRVQAARLEQVLLDVT